MKRSKTILATLSFLSTLNLPLSTAFALSTAFTYQGRLNDGVNPANGNYEILFRPFGVLTGGSQLTIPNIRPVIVSNGQFTTTMDFGSAIFDGGPIFLQLEVRTNGAASYTVLSPRQQLMPTPYAIFAAGAALANGQVDTPQLAAGAVTSAKVADGTLQPADLNLGAFGQTFWKVGGNAGTSTDFIGTTDDQPFDIRVNNFRVMRYRLNPSGTGITNAPSVIGGSSANSSPLTVIGATICGGGGYDLYFGNPYPNRVTADFGVVVGGSDNMASGPSAVVAGGYANTAAGDVASIGGGSGNTASGSASMVLGGELNTANGDYSFAAGRRAKADNNGSFVWADSNDFDFHSAFANQFAVRCIGGAKFVTAVDATGAQTAGVRLQAGDTAWSSISDRNAKKNFQPVNGEGVLEKLAAMPIQSWNYKWEPDTNTPHLGPMAQDFKAAFYPGRDDKSISTLEFDGVELAAIQGLNRKLEAKEAEILQLKASVAELKALVSQLARSNQQ